MKAVRFFFGTDTFGRDVEVAESATSHWFCRVLDWNGYNRSWSKWGTHEPSFETHGTNIYTNEVFEYETPQLFWGFQKLTETKELPRVRLPL